ncbi:hypothetical protein PISL3812_06968 [Talaromyces islandicus]|uniref:Uncharacterized protein n=1 Tax=Talaromyces islandicus TaxID=28573 RepID=A0A0U1M2Y0_TALIS|nr:hypothetical protein PISL3812_06968 [Talaromyces islandicus]
MSNEGCSPEDFDHSTEDEFSEELSESNPVDFEQKMSYDYWPFTAHWCIPSFLIRANEEFHAGYLLLRPKEGHPERRVVRIHVQMELADQWGNVTTELDRWNSPWVKRFNPAAHEKKRCVNFGRLGLKDGKAGEFYISCQIRYNDENDNNLIHRGPRKVLNIKVLAEGENESDFEDESESEGQSEGEF